MGRHTQTRCCTGSCSQGRHCQARKTWVDIDGPYQPRKALALRAAHALYRALLPVAFLAAMAAVLGFAAGYVRWGALGGLLP